MAREAVVDGSVIVPLPQAQPLEGLAAGKHAISIAAEGYHPFTAETYVQDAEVHRFRANLEPLPSPWYGRWWTWAIVGAVVVGGTTAGILVATRDDFCGNYDKCISF